jgi:preprotein translocase subunit Sss1
VIHALLAAAIVLLLVGAVGWMLALERRISRKP